MRFHVPVSSLSRAVLEERSSRRPVPTRDTRPSAVTVHPVVQAIQIAAERWARVFFANHIRHVLEHLEVRIENLGRRAERIWLVEAVVKFQD